MLAKPADATLLAQAVQRNFTQGRKTQSVVAVCLYIVCRKQVRPLRGGALRGPQAPVAGR